MTSILVLQLKRIGDLILTAPVTAALREEYPRARITIVALGTAGELAEQLPGVDRALVYQPGQSNWRLWAALRGMKPDVCFDCSGTQRAALMAWWSGAKHVVGYERLLQKCWRRRFYHALVAASVRGLHTLDYHFALVQPYVRAKVPPAAPLAVAAGTRAAIAELIHLHGLESGFALIHPGTARAEKYWLPERWAKIADHLHEQNLPVVITGGNDPGEKDHIEDILSRAKGPVINLAGTLSLKESAALIAQCRLALGVDTAAMHLAGNSLRPQIVLFGPTNPYHWRPLHADATIVLAGCEEVPCRRFTPHHTAAPMNAISTEMVLRGILRGFEAAGDSC